MVIEVCYCCPTAGFGEGHFDLACQFAECLHKFEAGYPYKFTVISNGGKPDSKTEALFCPFNAHFFERVNIAKDIGAWQAAAQRSTADVIVFLGGSTYIRGKNWCLRVADSFAKHGPGLYGSMVNSGDSAVNVAPHIRTSGFWTTPKLMNTYPMRVTKEEQRYPFEHGSNCLTSWVYTQGHAAWCVTWQGEYEMQQWSQIPNAFHRGDQSGLIFGDHLSAPPFYHTP